MKFLVSVFIDIVNMPRVNFTEIVGVEVRNQEVVDNLNK